MKGKKLGVDLGGGVDIPIEEQLPIIAAAGFDGFFTCYWDDERMQKLARLSKEYGLDFQSVHAPFSDIEAVWREGERGESFLQYLLRSLESTAQIEVPVMVCHAYKGFYTGEQPTSLGIDRLSRLVSRASTLGVTLAFENTEGEEFLAAVMNAFKGEKCVGFCWDSGHEQCYNGKDVLALYGDRLAFTHLNDNLGVTDYEGKINWTDDLHLMPFDGILDWQDAVDRLKKTGFDGPLTFELKRKDKLNRHTHDRYLKMTVEEYAAAAYARACRVGSLLLK